MDPVPALDPDTLEPIEPDDDQVAREAANELVDDFGGHDHYSEGVTAAMRAEGGL